MTVTDRTAEATHSCCAPDRTDSAALPIGAEVATYRSDLDRLIDGTEVQIGELQKKLAELRARRPHDPVKDYEFRDWSDTPVHLSQLFDRHRDLIVVHNMGASCNYCTLWADGFIGLRPHLESRAAFVVISPDPIEVQRSFAQKRGWTFRMVSARGTPFFTDMGFTDGAGDPIPGTSTFRRQTDGAIVRIQRAEFGPGDQFCAAWHLFDLLADGVADWQPQLKYR
jgi:predicted dithiol-disulfide oxidoreductase (DUF899 family)